MVLGVTIIEGAGEPKLLVFLEQFCFGLGFSFSTLKTSWLHLAKNHFNLVVWFSTDSQGALGVLESQTFT